MAFPIHQFNYKAGTLGEIESNLTAKSFNAYAHVTGITNSTITIDLGDAYTRAYEGFATGAEILFHVSAAAGTDTKHLGKWNSGIISKIRANVLEVSFDPTETVPTGDFDKYYCQVLTIPHFTNLTLKSNTTITPLTYSEENHYGGILALACSGTLKLDGGHIDLADSGIPPASKDLRPQTLQEQNGTLDTDPYSGWENSDAPRRLPINDGDGTVLIFAQNFNIADDSSRIGNPTFRGIHFNRSAADSYLPQAHTTNIGGSNILIVADSITNFSEEIIAKHRSLISAEINNNDTVDKDRFRGLARCFIASNTVLRNDEGLYAYDVISDSERVKNDLNIKTFGNGSSGSFNSNARVNNYAAIAAIDATRKIVTLAEADQHQTIGLTTNGSELLAVGGLVMVHFNHKSDSHTIYSGRFILAHVLGITGNDITLDAAIPEELYNAFDNYYCQIVTVPQFINYTLSSTHTETPKFFGAASTNLAQGGIFAIAVKDTCDLSGGKINVQEKGGLVAYGDNGLAHIGNAQDCNKLPIGQGHGSVFILAKNLIMNSETRIGATYSGANFGGQGGNRNANDDVNSFGGGYSGTQGYGLNGIVGPPPGGSPYNSQDSFPHTGYSSTVTVDTVFHGGRGGNGAKRDSDGNIITATGARQGAHIMIIANTITGFNQAAISTGGERGLSSRADPAGDWYIAQESENGGAGYGGGGSRSYADTSDSAGGGGGYQCGGSGGVTWNNTDYAYGGGGGGSGWAFIYCNNAVNQDTTNTVYY